MNSADFYNVDSGAILVKLLVRLISYFLSLTSCWKSSAAVLVFILFLIKLLHTSPRMFSVTKFASITGDDPNDFLMLGSSAVVLVFVLFLIKLHASPRMLSVTKFASITGDDPNNMLI